MTNNTARKSISEATFKDAAMMMPVVMCMRSCR